jgi:Fe-S-cluster formation regulator IscX/YfhJ
MFQFVEDTFGHENIAFPDSRNGETGTIHPREVRFTLYQEYIHFYYGFLGHGIHRDPPKCVKEAIYDAYPNLDNEE